MDGLTPAERELVALGAAIGSNCVHCIEYHIRQARRAGLGDGQIEEAIHLADKLRQTPALKVLAAALRLLAKTSASSGTDQRGSNCAQPRPDGGAEPSCCG